MLTEEEEARLLGRWWQAILAGDAKQLQAVAAADGGEACLRDWHTRKYLPVQAVRPHSSLGSADLSTDATSRSPSVPSLHSPQCSDGISATCATPTPMPAPLQSVLSEEYAGLHSLHIAAAMGSESCLEFLVRSYPANCNIDIKDRRCKRTAVLFAAGAGSLACVKLLAAAGAALSSSDRGGENVLHKAARADNLHLMQWLCQSAAKHGIKMNLRSKKLQTPLLLSRSRQVAQALITAGADPTARDLHGMDIACNAAVRNDAELLESVLLSNTAYLRNNLAGTAVNAKTQSQSQSQSRSPTNLEQSRILRTDGKQASSRSLQRGMQVQGVQGMPNSSQEASTAHYQDIQSVRLHSPLHLAVFHDSRQCVRTMCELFKSAYASVSMLNEADHIRSVISRDQLTISSVDYFDQGTGWTPLHLACAFGNLGVVEELLLHGACASVEDNQGASAIALAAFYGHTQIVSTLLSGAAYTNKRGETVLDVYFKLKLLQPKGAALKALLPPPGSKAAEMRATQSQSDAAKASATKREMELLQALAEDSNFMQLAVAGAQISPPLLQRISSGSSEEMNRRVVLAANTRAPVESVADMQERTQFMQQDRRCCDVMCVCRADDALEDLHSTSPTAVFYNHADADTDEELLALKGQRAIYAHKRVLVAYSHKFESMIRFVERQLQSEGKESIGAEGCLVLHLDDLDYSRGCQMLYFMYTSRLVPNAWQRVEWPLPVHGPKSSDSRSRAGSATSDDLVVGPEEFEADVVWLLNLLPVADEYIMKTLSLCVKDALVRKMLVDPAASAPLVFANTLGEYDDDGCELVVAAARQVLLNLSASFARYKMDAGSSRELLALCLAAMVVAPHAV